MIYRIRFAPQLYNLILCPINSNFSKKKSYFLESSARKYFVEFVECELERYKFEKVVRTCHDVEKERENC